MGGALCLDLCKPRLCKWLLALISCWGVGRGVDIWHPVILPSIHFCKPWCWQWSSCYAEAPSVMGCSSLTPKGCASRLGLPGLSSLWATGPDPPGHSHYLGASPEPWSPLPASSTALLPRVTHYVACLLAFFLIVLFFFKV